MLSINAAVMRGIIAAAFRELPHEACGYLAGTEGVVTTWVPMRNTDASAEHFSMEPAEQFEAVRKLRAQGLTVMAVYHSHPETPARPSEEDIRLAYDPNISYVIVSFERGLTTTKAFRIRAGTVEEEPIRIVEEREVYMNRTDDHRKKLSIVCFSGDFDKAVAAFTLATGAAAVNWEVSLFFTFWGLNILKKKRGRAFIGKGILARFFNFLMGGPKNLPLSRLNFGGLSPRLMTGMMKNRNVATLTELINSSKALGIRLIACEMAMHILGVKKEDLVDEVKDVVGVAAFLDMSKDAHILFIS